MKYKRKKGKKIIKSTKNDYDGIKFASGLETYCYRELKKHKIFGLYEGEVFQLIESFKFNNESFERQSNGKGELINRGEKKVLGIKYTPDFTNFDYIIECKGRANESFPIRWKLFKLWMTNTGDLRPLYKPQNQKECDIVVRMILEERKRNPLSPSRKEDWKKNLNII